MVFAAWREERVGAYRLQAQLKVRDLEVEHPSGVTSVRIDTPMHYCSRGGLEVGSHPRGCTGPVLSCQGMGETDWKIQLTET